MFYGVPVVKKHIMMYYPIPLKAMKLSFVVFMVVFFFPV
uniref:Uncharacterized protein n=1 Tax=Anguilla anguilla TaxID=7936 RepID=A0A0E9VYE2_ANGAN